MRVRVELMPGLAFGLAIVRQQRAVYLMFAFLVISASWDVPQ